MTPSSSAGLAGSLLQSFLGAPRDLASLLGTPPEVLIPALERNLVLRRAIPLLRAAGSPGTMVETAAIEEAERVASALVTIGRLTELARARGTEVLFPKALQHYPDMGHDIDLCVLESAAFDTAVMGELGATPARRGTFDRVSGKRGYTLPGSASPLEIHHGGFGHLGEHRAFLRRVLARRQICVTEGVDVSVPSKEDQLLIQTLQRMFSHFSVRVSDAMLAAQLIDDGDLDWDYVNRTAREFGFSAALSIWIGTIAGLCRRIAGRQLLRSGGPEATLSERDDVFRMNPSRVAPKLYGGVLMHALRRGNWETAGRIAVLPAAVMAFGLAGLGRYARGLRTH
jgi:hypothetical protein